MQSLNPHDFVVLSPVRQIFSARFGMTTITINANYVHNLTNYAACSSVYTKP